MKLTQVLLDIQIYKWIKPREAKYNQPYYLNIIEFCDLTQKFRKSNASLKHIIEFFVYLVPVSHQTKN